MFYDVKKGIIIDKGSSIIGPHSVLKNIHAEETAMRRIYKHYYKRHNINDMQLIIWKQNNHGLIRPVYCCKWCCKLIRKYGFPVKNVLTFNQEFDKPFQLSRHEKILTPALIESLANDPITRV